MEKVNMTLSQMAVKSYYGKARYFQWELIHKGEWIGTCSAQEYTVDHKDNCVCCPQCCSSKDIKTLTVEPKRSGYSHSLNLTTDTTRSSSHSSAVNHTITETNPVKTTRENNPIQIAKSSWSSSLGSWRHSEARRKRKDQRRRTRS